MMRRLIDLVESTPSEYAPPYDESDPVVCKYVEGGCWALAIAHNRLYGWPIYALGADDDDYAAYGADTDFFHGMVMHPSGVVIDITGPHSPEDFVEKWGEPIAKIGDESDLSAIQGEYMRSYSLARVEEAMQAIDAYLKPRYPDLYRSTVNEVYPMEAIPQKQVRDKIRDIMRGKLELLTEIDPQTKLYRQPRQTGSFDLLLVRDRVGIGFVWLSRITLADVIGYTFTEIGLLDEFQGRGYGKAIYNAILAMDAPLISGGMQTADGQKMWRWLIGRPDLHAYVVDIQGDDDILYPLEQSPIDPWNVHDSRLIVSKSPLAHVETETPITERLVDDPVEFAVLMCRRDMQMSPKAINNGWCWGFAIKLEKMLGDGAEVVSTTGVEGAFPGHSAVLYRGRYYDAESPRGVDSIPELAYCRRMRAIADGDLLESMQSPIPDHLRALVQDGHVEVWRAVRAYSGFLNDLLPGSGLGKCWSYEENGAIPYDGGNRGVIYRLHGLMPISSIDWGTTVALDDNGEREIRAHSGKPFILLGLDEIDLAGRTRDTDLKPAISGQTMSTGPWV